MKIESILKLSLSLPRSLLHLLSSYTILSYRNLDESLASRPIPSVLEQYSHHLSHLRSLVCRPTWLPFLVLVSFFALRFASASTTAVPNSPVRK